MNAGPEQARHDAYERLLLQEVIPALGCTEPSAIALATAKAREVLGSPPDSVTVLCSGNIIKNALSVIVPHAHGQSGIKIAAALGVVAGDAAAGLEVLAPVTDADVEHARELVAHEQITVHFVEGIPGLYVAAKVTAGQDDVTVELRDDHSRFHSITHNGVPLVAPPEQPKQESAPKASERNASESSVGIEDALLDLAGILAFADEVDLSARPELVATLEAQIELNLAIAREGLSGRYGAAVGATLLEFSDPNEVRVRARALTAAGSDARMGGSDMPVMINSGSGNQGLTVSLPVIEFADSLGSTHDELLRALIVSNLVGVYEKKFIGRLSAFCGVVTAAAAAGAGIARLQGQDADQIGMAITNAIATTGGMVCDGAKASCASKISIAVENAVSATQLSARRRAFPAGEGLVGATPDQTIRNIGRMARTGMRSTDVEILSIMLEQHTTD